MATPKIATPNSATPNSATPNSAGPKIFDAGSPALTFADALGAGAAGGIAGYPDLVEGAAAIGLIGREQAKYLAGQAAAEPYRAGEVLAEARVLARVIHRIFAGLARGAAPGAGDIAFLNDCLARAMGHLAIAPGERECEGGYAWSWVGGGTAELSRMLWPVARDAADLLVGQDPARIRLCAASDCRRLFLDTSKGGRRRWCRMQSCGNRAKARRHARRNRFI